MKTSWVGLMTAALLTISPLHTLAALVHLIAGNESGQGFVFNNDRGGCYAITAAHVVQGSDPQSTSITLRGSSGYERRAKPLLKAQSQPSDDVLLLRVETTGVDECLPKADRDLVRLTGYSLAYREASGTLVYLPVVPRGQADQHLLLGVPDSQNCIFQQGRSGGFVLSDVQEIIGMFVKTRTRDCIGFVLPLRRLDQFAKDYGLSGVPIHPLVQKLMHAAWRADERTFSDILTSGINVNNTDLYGNFALERVATAYNNFHFYVDRVDPQGTQRIHRRAEFCRDWTALRLRMLRELLARGARPDGPLGGSWPPLTAAVSSETGDCDNSALIEALLNAGADPNHAVRDDEGNVTRPLKLAVDASNVAAVRLLLQNGADASFPDSWGLTPLMRVVVRPSLAWDGWCHRPAAIAKLLSPRSDLNQSFPRGDYRVKAMFNTDQGLKVGEALARRIQSCGG